MTVLIYCAPLILSTLTRVETLYKLMLEVIRMFSSIQKWGNSNAIRIPKGILEDAVLQENDRVEIKAEKGCIIVSRVDKKHKTLEERLAGYEGGYNPGEWDTASPKGKEVW